MGATSQKKELFEDYEGFVEVERRSQTGPAFNIKTSFTTCLST